MKKISVFAVIALLLFTHDNVKAQYIPDPNFAATIAYECPTCIDANHYLTADAQTLTELGNENYGVTDLTGLDGFTNLEEFACFSQNISVFPALPPNLISLSIGSSYLNALPPLPASLQILNVGNNELTDLPPLPSGLLYLDISTNDISNLNLPPNLVNLDVSGTLITSLNPLPVSLEWLNYSGQNIGNLNSLPPALAYLDCSGSSVTALPPLPATLKELHAETNQLVQLPALPSGMTHLYCTNNNLTSLPSLPDSLQWLSCSNNQLTSLPPLPEGLRSLDCAWNPLTHLPALPSTIVEGVYAIYCNLIDVPPLPPLMTSLFVSHNSITSLPDLPPQLMYLEVDYNPVSCLPFLPSTCDHLVITSTNITCLPNYPNPYFANYYTLCDAGNQNSCMAYPTISGKVYGDFNSNTVFDAGDYTAGNMVVRSTPGNFLGITDTSGNYKIAVPVSTINTISPNPIPFYTIAPEYFTVTFDSTSGQESQDNNFGILAVNPGANIAVTNLTSLLFRPGFNSDIYITVSNMGTTSVDASVTLTFDPLLTLIYLEPAGSQSGNTITWDFLDLHPFQTTTFMISVNCPSGTPLGTLVNNSVTALLNGASDIDESNNSASLSKEVVGSFDPNDKEVNDPTLTPTELVDGKYLEYTIHFQNTGTAPATFINVIDTLSDNLDATTFQMIAASHHYDITLTNDLSKPNYPVYVKWLFNNIQLPDSSVDFAGSQGFVQFRIKPKNNLLIGDQIQNTAGIYFDFNEPVLTNTTVTTVALTEGIANVNDDFFRAAVYPNPAVNSTTIHFDHVNSPQLSFQIANELGSVITEKMISVTHESFDVSLDLEKFHSGVYIITVKSLKAVQVMKLMKD